MKHSICTPASFFPKVRSGLRDNPLKVLRGPSRRLRRKTSFFMRVLQILEQAPHFYCYRPFRQLIQTSARFNMEWFGSRSPVSSRASIFPITPSPFAHSPSCIKALTLELICTLLPYLSAVLRPFEARLTTKHSIIPKKVISISVISSLLSLHFFFKILPQELILGKHCQFHVR